MRNAVRSRFFWTLATFLPGLLFAPLARAQYRDEYGQYRDQYGEIRQTVARISYIEGSVSFSRGDDPDNWQPADRNVPMTIGDRVYTADRSRLELQVHGGDFVRLGGQTDLAALNLTDDTKQFSVKIGVASFQLQRLKDDEVFEIDTPNAAITVDRPGDFRVDVDPDGNTKVIVRHGHVTVAAGGGQVPLQSGDEMDIGGIDAPRYDIVAAGSLDGWDRWVQQREGRVARARSLQYVSEDVVGVDDLDEYGRWQEIPDYGWAWSPTVVAVDWVPYRAGHWIWQDPWGWTWVSAEPWGWAPYHYGRWAFSSSRWYWIPVAHTVSIATYSPALVAFVGGGPGWSATATFGGGAFVGWFPLGPRDPLVPWWARRSVNVNVTNVTYVNRTYVTVVNQNTFVSGGIVTNAVVRDSTVVRQVISAPVARGPLPVVPTSGALRVAVRTGLPAPPRPPSRIVERAVVARVAPPPAPPSFQAKLAVIRENRGAPVEPVDAAKMSVESRGRAQAITNVRPVATEPGRMTLAPRGRAAEAGAASRPEPVAPSRGRPLATAERPVAPAPVTSSSVPPGREREIQPPPSRELARPAPQAPIAQPTQPVPQRGREQPERVAPPAERKLAPPPSPPPLEKRTPTDQGESWRNRQRPTEAAPRAVPQTQQPTPPPAERGRSSFAPRPEGSTAQPTPQRGLERRQIERPTPEGRPVAVTPQARPQTEERGRGSSGPPPGREAAPPPQPARQVERPAPQKVEQKKEDKGKEKPSKKGEEEKKKDERERKPD